LEHTNASPKKTKWIWNAYQLMDNSVQLGSEKDVIMECNPIGQAELQNEIQRNVKIISDRKEMANITTKTSLELDEELKKY